MKRVIQTKPKPWCPECAMEMVLIYPEPDHNCWGRTGGAHDTLSVMEFYISGLTEDPSVAATDWMMVCEVSAQFSWHSACF